MKHSKIGTGLILMMIVLIISGIACTNYQIPGRDSGGNDNACEECHTDYDRLVEVHSPDSGAPVTGYGRVAPHYEP
jgi:hypothetical protein